MKKLLLFLTVTCLLFAFDNAQAQDAITNVTAPDMVYSGQTSVVTVDYTISESRDIIVNVQLNSDPWTSYAFVRKNILAGTSTTNINVPINAGIPIATAAYKIGVMLVPVGKGWADRLDEYTKVDVDAGAFTGPVDLIKKVTAPAQVVQGETITVPVEYEVSESRDIIINFNLNSDPWTNYGTSTVTVGAGTGTTNIDVIISADIPVATGAYSLGTAVTPVGGSWPDRIHSLKTINIDATVSTSLEYNQIDLRVNVSPNPAQESATIKSETAIKTVSLYSLSGKLILNEQVEANEYQLNLTSYSKGIYFLNITNANGTLTTKLVIN